MSNIVTQAVIPPYCVNVDFVPSISDSEITIQELSENEYIVERLLKKRTSGKRHRRVEYLVKWEGYPDAETSWVKKEDIHQDMVAQFEEGLRG